MRWRNKSKKPRSMTMSLLLNPKLWIMSWQSISHTVTGALTFIPEWDQANTLRKTFMNLILILKRVRKSVPLDRISTRTVSIWQCQIKHSIRSKVWKRNFTSSPKAESSSKHARLWRHAIPRIKKWMVLHLWQFQSKKVASSQPSVSQPLYQSGLIQKHSTRLAEQSSSRSASLIVKESIVRSYTNHKIPMK